MIAPSVLPGRAFQRIDRVSRCLFHWRAADISLFPMTGQIPTFGRDSAGGATIDSTGTMVTPVHSQPRFMMVDADGDGVRETPVLLIERTSANIVPQSDNFSLWTTGSATITAGQSDPFGGVAASLLSVTTTGQARGISLAFSGNGTKAAAIFLKAWSTSTSDIAIYDTTAVEFRHRVRVTWANGVPSVTSNLGSGTIFPAQKLNNGWWRISFTANGVVASNAHLLYVYPSTTDAIGAVYAFGAQAEDIAIPTSHIATAGSTTARAADRLSWAFDALPQPMTAYVRFVERGSARLGESVRIFEIGNATGGVPRFSVVPSGIGKYVVAMTTESGSQSVETSGPADVGDMVELLCILRPDGSLQMAQSVNGGAVYTSAVGAGAVLPAAWAGSVLWLGQRNGGNAGLHAFESVKIAAGVRSLQDMRGIL